MLVSSSRGKRHSLLAPQISNLHRCLRRLHFELSLSLHLRKLRRICTRLRLGKYLCMRRVKGEPREVHFCGGLRGAHQVLTLLLLRGSMCGI